MTTTSNVPRDNFNPKPSGKSYWKLRLRSLILLPKHKVIPALLASGSLYLLLYNCGVRYWKGPDHPINRWGWQHQKANGTLSSERRAKEETILAYYKSRLFNTKDRATPVV